MTAAVANLPAVAVPARLPMPAGAAPRGITPAQWRVLVDVIFPSAKNPESILLAVDYCRSRGLDVMKRMIHIVPVWNSALKREVETIWPGINEIQTTAARTNAWAGMDSAKLGPMIRRVFKGSRKIDGNWKPVAVEVHLPEWAEVTVYRLVSGHRCAFTERVYWLEAYSTSGGRDSELPTDMWVKRPIGQLQKVTKAAALRAAFPEEGELCAEEMEGKVVEAGGVVIEHEADPELPPPPPATFAVTVPYGGDPVLYPRNRGGAKEALAEISKMFADKYYDVVRLNNEILDTIATRFPDLAEEISELRADAALKLAPPPDEPDPNAEPDEFVHEFLGDDDTFPGDMPSKAEG
jgi:phage recombination protein Bet